MSLLEEVKKMAVEPEKKTDEQFDAEIHALRRAESSLFGIEVHSKRTLALTSFRLSQDKKFQNTNYKRLSLEPLSWTRGKWAPVPAFALYSLNSPRMIISGGNRNAGERCGVLVPDGLPEAITDIYYKYADENLADRRHVVRISSIFNGVIPAEVRGEINRAVGFFSTMASSGSVRDNVYIMAEVQEWQKTSTPIPQPPRMWLDPLVVGWDGEDLWLVSSFDPTPLETYVMKEFPALEAPKYLSLPPHK